MDVQPGKAQVQIDRYIAIRQACDEVKILIPKCIKNQQTASPSIGGHEYLLMVAGRRRRRHFRRPQDGCCEGPGIDFRGGL